MVDPQIFRTTLQSCLITRSLVGMNHLFCMYGTAPPMRSLIPSVGLMSWCAPRSWSHANVFSPQRVHYHKEVKILNYVASRRCVLSSLSGAADRIPTGSRPFFIAPTCVYPQPSFREHSPPASRTRVYRTWHFHGQAPRAGMRVAGRLVALKILEPTLRTAFTYSCRPGSGSCRYCVRAESGSCVHSSAGAVGWHRTSAPLVYSGDAAMEVGPQRRCIKRQHRNSVAGSCYTRWHRFLVPCAREVTEKTSYQCRLRLHPTDLVFEFS